MMATAAATFDKRAEAANATVAEKLRSLQQRGTVYKPTPTPNRATKLTTKK